MIGWIKLHRRIKKHWLWEDPVKFQWWLTMLLEVNYVEGKMLLGNQLIKVARGSSTNSLRTWADLFGCGTKAATNFFDLLESDKMITRVTLGKGKHSTTLINITNYEEFQGKEETLTDTQTTTLTDTQGKREGHTIKEGKESKEPKEKKKSVVFTPPSLDDVIEFFNKNSLDVNAAERKGKRFWRNYDARGWKIGGARIESWKPLAQNWIDEDRDREKQFKNPQKPNNNVKTNQQEGRRVGRLTEEEGNKLSNPEGWSVMR